MKTYWGWGRALKARGEVARPDRADRLQALSQEGPAMGNRRSYGDAALNDAGRIVDMTRIDRILAFDPATGHAHVQAGMRLGDLVRLYAPRGWLPAVLPGTGFATVGGAIANDVHGKNHHNAGAFGDHLADITLVQHGKRRRITPKNAGLWKATIGGLGQTGLIESATLKFKKIAGDVMLVTERRAESWEEHLDLLDTSRATYVVGWIDATATGAALGRGIVEEGELAAGLVKRSKGARAIPFDAPSFALAPPVVRAFNTLYYHRVPAAGRTQVRQLETFFFPLDKIHDWNRLYGRRGFHQFQCVVPEAESEALKAMLDRIARTGQASPLAVLKRMGPESGGHLSFPMPGYTLAVDFPNRPQAERLISALEAMCAEAGGRIYFAKDALATPERVAEMYPDHPKWLKEVEKADPDGIYLTDLVRRLKLRPDHD